MILRKGFGIFVCIATTMGILSCASTKTGTDYSSAKEASKMAVSFTNEPGGTLTVQNNINESVVLFAGAISNNHVIGGVKNMTTRTFDIFDDLPSESRMGTFLLRGVKESVYRSKGSALNNDDVIYGRVITYDMNDRSRKTNITIDARNGGDGIVYFENNSNLVVELRLDNPAGELIAVLPPFQRNLPVHLEPNPRGYTYFPVWRYYDKKNNTIATISTKDLSQGRRAMPVVPGTGDIPLVRLSKPDVSNIYAPVFKIRIENETNDGIYFSSGDTPLTSENGAIMINSGSRCETFEFDMKNMKEREVGGLKFDLGRGAENDVSIKTHTYKAGHIYAIRLKSDYTTEIKEYAPDGDLNSLDIPLVNERS